MSDLLSGLAVLGFIVVWCAGAGFLASRLFKQ